ncbi:MAG: hypothetical protein WBW94_10135, partial [Anaerolineales bacterium]
MKVNSITTKAIAALMIVMIALMALPLTSAYAAACTFTSKATGNWSAAGTWTATGTGCSTYPGQTFAGDTVTIAAGNTVTVDVSPDNSIASLTFPAGVATNVNINSGITLNVSGTITIPRGASPAVNTLAVGAGTLNAGSIAFTGSGTAQRHVITISTGTLTVSGNVTEDTVGNTSPTITFTGAGNLNLGGALWAGGGGTLTTVAGSTVNYDGIAQAVAGFAYSNLILSGSGAKTLSAGTTVGGNMTLSGTATTTTIAVMTIGGNLNVGSGTTFATGATNTWTLTVSGTTTVDGTLTLANTGTKTFTGNVTVDNGGTWNETGASSIAYAGNLQNNGTYTANTGAHTFSGTGKTISGTVSIPSLTISGITMNSGALTVSTTLAGASTLTNTGTLNFGGTSITPTLTATAVGNTVNYNAAGAQTVKVTAYDQLVLSGSGIKTIGAVTFANANSQLSIDPSGTATATLSASLSANGLILGGVGQAAGTYGSTASSATNKSNTYFTAGTTTILTVGKSASTITFGTAPTPTYLGGNFTVSATTTNTDSSTLTYSYVSGPCAFVSGATFSSSGAGTCVVQASGAATTHFTAASQTQSVTIAKATPTLSASGGPFTYDGSAHPATVNGSVSGSVSNILYNGSSTAVNAATYTVTADFAPTDTTDYNSLTRATATGSLVINQATSTTTVTGGTFTYDGSAHAATVSVTGAGGLSLTPSPTYTGSCSSAPTTVAEGTTCTASYTYAGDTNHTGSSDSKSVTINAAAATINVNGYTGTYDGSAHGASLASATGVNNEDLTASVDLGSTFMNVPGGTAHWTFTNGNYVSQSGDADVVI